MKDERDISPYDLSVSLDLHPYIQRLLLRTDPTLNPHDLRKFNYDQRRSALLLFFKEIGSNRELNSWSLLLSDDLLRHIVLFL